MSVMERIIEESLGDRLGQALPQSGRVEPKSLSVCIEQECCDLHP